MAPSRGRRSGPNPVTCVLGVFTLVATFLLFLEMHETAQIKALAEAQGVSLAAAEGAFSDHPRHRWSRPLSTPSR